jgi:hypothetical protein
MSLGTFNRKAGERNDGNEQKNQNDKVSRQAKSDDGPQEISGTYLAPFGVRVAIIERVPGGKVRCRRLQDGAEITLTIDELIFVPGSSEADKARELFKHKTRWRDPGDLGDFRKP